MPFWAFCLVLSANGILAWGTAEMEIFDLVEELGSTTFYQLLNVSQDASAAEIRRAYRRKSLLYHPDKNKESEAEVIFRQIAAVADVLRDEEKRAIYDRVLVEGLPNWQQPVYYYRQVRRMGTLELLVAVSLIMTVVHYGYLCAVFVDQYYQAEIATTRRKRKSKKSKSGGSGKDDTEGDLVLRSPFPGPLKLLPFVLAFQMITFIGVAPSLWKQWKEDRLQRQEEEERRKQEEADMERLAKEEAIRAADSKQRRIQHRLQQKQDALQDVADADDMDWGRIPNVAETAVEENQAEEEVPAVKEPSKPWTEDELMALTRAFVRFPGGTPSRWEKIAAEVGRSVSEVTAQIKRLKHRVNKAEPMGAGLEASKRSVQASSRLTSDITVRSDVSSDSAAAASSTASRQWSQEEQKCLEKALVKYGRDVEDRWTHIASAIPGRSKEECLARYKYIALQVRQRKPAQASAASS